MTGFAPTVHQIVAERSGGVCEVCGLECVRETHHRRPRAAGGSRRDTTNTPANALGLCSSCHRMVENYRNVARLMGWLVPQAADNPGSVRVLYRAQWCHLDELGNLTPMEGTPHA